MIENQYGCKLCKNAEYPMLHDCSSANKILDIENTYSNMIKMAEYMKKIMHNMEGEK